MKKVIEAVFCLLLVLNFSCKGGGSLKKERIRSILQENIHLSIPADFEIIESHKSSDNAALYIDFQVTFKKEDFMRLFRKMRPLTKKCVSYDKIKQEGCYSYTVNYENLSFKTITFYLKGNVISYNATLY